MLLILLIVHFGHAFSVIVLISNHSGLYPFMIVSRHFESFSLLILPFSQTFFFSVDNLKGWCLYFSFYFILKTCTDSHILNRLRNNGRYKAFQKCQRFFLDTDMFPLVTKPWDTLDVRSLLALLPSHHTVILGITRS